MSAPSESREYANHVVIVNHLIWISDPSIKQNYTGLVAENIKLLHNMPHSDLGWNLEITGTAFCAFR